MNFTLILEYVDAIRSTKDNFDKLSNLRYIHNYNGNPVMLRGIFNVILKSKNI